MYTTPFVVREPILTVELPFPIVVRLEPLVLIAVVPKTVRPPLAVIRPVDVNVPAEVKLAPEAVRDVMP